MNAKDLLDKNKLEIRARYRKRFGAAPATERALTIRNNVINPVVALVSGGVPDEAILEFLDCRDEDVPFRPEAELDEDSAAAWEKYVAGHKSIRFLIKAGVQRVEDSGNPVAAESFAIATNFVLSDIFEEELPNIRAFIVAHREAGGRIVDDESPGEYGPEDEGPREDWGTDDD